MADVSDGSLASWVQTGGVGLFAAAVLWQLRRMEPILKQVGETLSALLERERMRAEREAIEVARRGGGVPEDFESPTTGPIVEMRTPRAQTSTPARGTAAGRYSIKNPGGG